MEISLEQVRVDLGGLQIVGGVSFTVAAGETAGLIGPNGSGKSTLLRTLYRHLRPVEGVVAVGGDDLLGLPARENARRVAAVPQERSDDFDFTVREVVGMGRLPHAGLLSGLSADRSEAVEAALNRTGVSGLSARSFTTLSGGERQRVLVARALAQEAPVVVLDEPTNHLDIRHQLELLELIGELGLTTLMAIHDLNLAARYCDSVHVLQAGALVASGPTREVLTADLIESVFDVHCTVHTASDGALQLDFRSIPRRPFEAGGAAR